MGKRGARRSGLARLRAAIDNSPRAASRPQNWKAEDAVECPDCGALVSALFGLDDHRRGARCRANQEARALREAGYAQLTASVGAALLSDLKLGPHITQGAIGASRESRRDGRYHTEQGYWVPHWFAAVLDPRSPEDFEDYGAFKSRFSSGYTSTVRRPNAEALRALHALADSDDEGRDVIVAALRLGGLRGALAMLDGEDVADPEEYARLSAALFADDEDDEDDSAPEDSWPVA